MNDLVIGVVLLLVVLLAHLLEEVRTGFRRRFPLGEMPRSLFVAINVVLYLYIGVTLLLALAGRQAAVPLAWGFALAMAANGLGHMGIMVWRRQYFPGGVTAFPLLVAAIYLGAVLWRSP